MRICTHRGFPRSDNAATYTGFFDIRTKPAGANGAFMPSCHIRPFRAPANQRFPHGMPRATHVSFEEGEVDERTNGINRSNGGCVFCESTTRLDAGGRDGGLFGKKMAVVG